jgi:hypothetical protein
VRALLVGCGVVGTRAARQLLNVGLTSLVIDDPRTSHVDRVIESIGTPCESLGRRSWEEIAPDIIVLATPPGHVRSAARALALGAHVVSVTDASIDVDGLLALNDQARSAGRSVVIGAGFSPGLTCVLARHAAAEFARVDEIHVAKTGTAGPACAVQHHRALSSSSKDWRDGEWISKPGGSGRELCWFPEPIGGADCYRADLIEPVLLQPHFAVASRITARVSATRRDRLTSRLPMMRKPHAEAGPGAVRVEVRGLRNSVADSVVMGCMDRASIGAGAVIAVVTAELIAGRAPTGANGLAAWTDTTRFLHDLSNRGVKCARFEGASAAKA